jgi:UDP-N-acetylglucosamine--N-acetylmuramyl-(pentapeptide) pyrophosphoryl-undecaprenol N-acetylglucosamine transferase
MKIAITGGHHSSALPVIKQLQKDGHEIIWLGHRYSVKGNKNPTLEFREITALNIRFYDLKAGKFYKTYDPVRLLKIPLGLVQAFLILLWERPNVILSFGGYLAVPVVIAGRLQGIKSITHEQTLVAGYANKVISKFVDKILISWEASRNFFPAKKTIYSGLPLREEIFSKKPNPLHFADGLPTIYVTAGKTGSHKINETVREALPNLLVMCNIIHQCGDHSLYNDYEKLLDAYTKISGEPAGRYYLKKFVYGEEIGGIFNEADMIVSRAGAHTISEVIALEKPVLLIPIPWSSHNEQMKNAQFVVRRGLGRILEEGDLTPLSLTKEVKKMLENLGTFKLKEKSEKINSVEIITNELYKTAEKTKTQKKTQK